MGGDAVRKAWVAELRGELERRRVEHLLRELREVESAQGATLVIEGREYVQFCTNNYLGLAADPEVVEAAREAVARYGTGAGASRLVAGSMSLHHLLEAELARFKGTEAALVFPTGFMANLAVLATFAGEGDLIVSDKLNHASLLDAAKFSGAAARTFPHRSYRRAAALLGAERTDGNTKDTKSTKDHEAGGVTETRRHEELEDHEESHGQTQADTDREEKGNAKGKEKRQRKFLVTDTVFSMDGDVADLREVCGVAEGVGALVVVDEAHATGVLGARGAGVAELQGVEGRIAVTVGTLSKALGSIGGFVAGPREAVEMLINRARSFIYTTALPPACCAAALAALKIVQREPGRRERVMTLARHVKGELVGMGFDCGDSAPPQSPIVPVILGEAEESVRAAEKLKEQGIFVAAIRPPTVAKGAARLRISLMATHTDGQVELLLDGMRRVREGMKESE